MLFKKQILFLSFTLAVSSFLPSCESNLADDSQTESNYAQQQTVLPENEAQKAFARILSVAADKYPSVRTFLKNEMYSMNTGSIDLVIAPVSIR